jgi:hypothetical protein
MLKRLHAMPDSTLIDRGPVTPESQRVYLDKETAADAISLAEYRSELALRQENRNTIDFALWLAKKMGGVSRDDVDDAESLIRSAMLVFFVDRTELKLPTRTAFVRLFKAAKDPKAKLNEDRMKTFLREAPTEFQQLARGAMGRFINMDLPQLRVSSTADKLLYGASGDMYFVVGSLDEDVREYDRMVAREWDRVTRGEADDPAVVSTVFLFLATGLPPKASMLLREAKEVIRVFRRCGLDSRAVMRFVGDHAPEAIREELQKFWTGELKPEAEEQLGDRDPNWPDTHMERALEYLRTSCRATWKARKR